MLNLLDLLIRQLKDKKILLFIIAIVIIILSFFYSSCSSLTKVTTIDSLKIYNYKHNIDTKL